MFLKFSDDNERRKYGGSAFIELQYCRLPHNIKTSELFKSKNLPTWQYNDALFVHDDDIGRLADVYKELFGEAMYPNHSFGLYYEYGVNYFRPDSVEQIINRISDAKPEEYEIILSWLEKARNWNGFYILGI